ncbi:hypothetical protein MLD38_012561 [Melastoma candidum]|uniref:Uncharacterized protein n=1 Tax=Melastoma candidum TaxID=119954 RepID=A0ACB9R6Q2_9MYRT|nr:hypothetical protein MLD38_012561 [Melastoma candidum]
MSTDEPSCLDILRRLKSTDPPLWLAPNPSLSQQARNASLVLFSSLRPHAPQSPVDHLLIDGFDAEQIWQQIELQSHPLLSLLKREVKRFEKSPREISRIFAEDPQRKDIPPEVQEREGRKEEEDVDEFDEDEAGASEDLDEEGDGAEEEEEEDGAEEEDEDRDEDESESGDEGAKGGIEDGFLKIKELEEYLQKDEAREYGFEDSAKKKAGNKERRGIDEDDSSDEGEKDDGDDDEPGGFGLDDDEEEEEIENARYEDFFGGNRKKAQRKPKVKDNSEEDASDEEDGDDRENENEGNHNLSTHEKELLNMKSKIEQMETANLEPKTWTMQGEVTAAKRPKNSALEVDLDFEHNARPAPVITEEVTASLEDLIRKRIMEAHFNDVEKPPSLPGKGPREIKELDENKSKKGLAEIYEDEYATKANLVSAPSSFSDEQKKEATLLFKKLCLKLDALSHFHFAPKPVIEDMSIQANVPALAMEEIAPLAVSDAAMLAPEEVFSGKGDVKDESELTQADRKRRRAKKKRIHKAEEAKRMAKKTKHRTTPNPDEGKED